MSYHDLPQAILTHLAFTLVSVLFGLILGVVLGILLSRRPKLSKFVLPVLSVFNTIPGIVFVGLLFIWLGMPAGHSAHRAVHLRDVPYPEKHLCRAGLCGPTVY